MGEKDPRRAVTTAFAAPSPLHTRSPRFAFSSTRQHQRLLPRSCARALPPWAADAARKHALRVAPHAGSHFTRRDNRGGRSGRFFEGWYLRAVLPDTGEAFAWMFSVEEAAAGGARQVVAQFLDADERLLVRRFPDGARGWFADAECLSFGHWGTVSGVRGKSRVLRRRAFVDHVRDGFQMTAGGCCGRLEGCEGSGADVVSWDLDMRSLLSWGARGAEGRCTATWLSHLPVFEPGYQVRVAGQSLLFLCRRVGALPRYVL
jgi:Tocopherol cyclase